MHSFEVVQSGPGLLGVVCFLIIASALAMTMVSSVENEKPTWAKFSIVKIIFELMKLAAGAGLMQAMFVFKLLLIE